MARTTCARTQGTHARKERTNLYGDEAAERAELGDGDCHLRLVVGVPVRGGS
jgi:hypothetical protein